jgi:hypothetical protein
MASFEHIRETIKTKLLTINSIQEVQDFPTLEFTGFPAVVVKTVGNDTNFQTNNDNKRTYIFRLYVFQEIETPGNKKARRIVEGVVDDILDSFDTDQLLSGITLATNEVMIISMPALAEIYEDAKYTVAEVELRIITQFSISAS